MCICRPCGSSRLGVVHFSLGYCADFYMLDCELEHDNIDAVFMPCDIEMLLQLWRAHMLVTNWKGTAFLTRGS